MSLGPVLVVRSRGLQPGICLVILGALITDVAILLGLRRAFRLDRPTALLRSGIVAGTAVFARMWLLAHAWPADLTLVCKTSVVILAYGITSFSRPS